MGNLLASPSPAPAPDPLGVKIVIISDTHNDHRSLVIPDGDVLIHGGDFTTFGKEEHAEDFNAWLGTLPHRIKIVVNGNHECNAPWKAKTREMLTNAVFLQDEYFTFDSREGKTVKLYGSNFFWSFKKGSRNPHYDMIDDDVSIIVAHNPAEGHVDGGNGCPALRERCRELSKMQLRCVIGGHIHDAYGVEAACPRNGGIVYVNAANCGDRRKCVPDHPPVVIDL
jgi:calcineurin-like phosphoesterase family protein